MENFAHVRRQLWSDFTVKNLPPSTPPTLSPNTSQPSPSTSQPSPNTSLVSPNISQLSDKYQETSSPKLSDYFRQQSQAIRSMKERVASLSPIASPLGSDRKGKMKRYSSNDSLLLNFRYDKTRNFDVDLSNQTFQSSFSFSSAESQKIPQHLLRYRKRNQKLKNDFSKYIPAPLSCLSIPKILLNIKDKKELVEAQEALQSLAPHTSLSDSLLGRMSQKKRRSSQFGSFTKVINCCGQEEREEMESVSHFLYPQPMPKLNDIRFNFNHNTAYCQSTCDPQTEFSALLYAEISDKPNYYLSHVQTELAVAGMLTFFHPWTDVQLLWVKDIRGQITELMSTGKYMAKFTEVVYLKRFEAVLVVSEPAGKLLRHGKLAFLHSLAAALGINQNRLLVLSKK